MLPKLLLLVVILLIAWYGVRFVTRIGQLHHAMRRAAQQATANAQARRWPAPGGHRGGFGQMSRLQRFRARQERNALRPG